MAFSLCHSCAYEKRKVVTKNAFIEKCSHDFAKKNVSCRDKNLPCLPCLSTLTPTAMLGTYLLKLCLAKSVIITPLPVDQGYRVSRIRWFMKTVQ